MKKLYLSLLLTTPTSSLLCMEQWHNPYYDYDNNQHETVPVYIAGFNTITTSYPYKTNQYYGQHSSYGQSHEPSWEFLNSIMNAPYESSQPPIMNEVELMPIYKPTNITNMQQEKKSLLKTNSLKPDISSMKKLHAEAIDLIRCSTTYKLGAQTNQKHLLVSLIKQMNNVRNKNIHEDTMGRFAYKYTKKTRANDRDISPIPALFFTILKQYALTVDKTGEQLPLHFDTKTTSLKEILTLPSHTNSHNIHSSERQTSCDFDQYPAFFKVLYALKHAYQEIPSESIHIFNDYVYGSKNELRQDYNLGLYKELKNEFYNKAYSALVLKEYCDIRDMYNLIEIIDNAKKSHDINNEDDLATSILGFHVDEPITARFLNIFNSSHDIDNVKKRIIIFCALAKKYNNARGSKITPTINQHQAYYIKKTLGIHLPASLCNDNLLDEHVYALEEFTQLHNEVRILIDSNDSEVQKCINTLYPPKKGTP